jgi:hypothetical protein
MNDWPSNWDTLWLLLGLVPLGIVLLMARKGGASEMYNLSFLFVLINWIGYHSTPWLAVRTGGWHSFLLKPDYVSDGMMFSTLGMMAFLTGYGFNRNAIKTQTKGPVHLRDAFRSFRTSPGLIVGVACFSFILFTLNVGGPSEIWEASYLRGQGQFDAPTDESKIIGVFVTVGSFVNVILALISSLALFSPRSKGALSMRAMAVVGLMAATVPMMHSFSRVTGYALILAAFVGILMRGWKKMAVPALFLIVVGCWWSWTGYTQRGLFKPGIGTFMEALIAPQTSNPGQEEEGDAETLWDDPALNPLNALDPFTTRAWTRTLGEPPDLIEGGLGLLAALQPVPSQLVPFEVRAGESLSSIMGTEGSTGITTPALGELYYWFGLWGVLVLYPFGRLCRWIDRRRLEAGSVVDFVLWVGTVAGFVVGLHSGVRAMTRMSVYGLLMLGMSLKKNRPYNGNSVSVGPIPNLCQSRSRATGKAEK